MIGRMSDRIPGRESGKEKSESEVLTGLTEKRGYSAAENREEYRWDQLDKVSCKVHCIVFKVQDLEKGTHLENCTEERAKREAVKAYRLLRWQWKHKNVLQDIVIDKGRLREEAAKLILT